MQLSRVILFTTKLPSMARFYHHVIGLAVLNGDPDNPSHWIEFAAGPCKLALHEADEDPPARASTSVLLSFPVDDVAAARAQLVAKGVTMGNLVTTPHVTFSNGQDPDGNWFQVASC